MSDKDTNKQQLNRANKDVERASVLIDNPVTKGLGMAASAAILRKATRTRSFSKMTERALKVMNGLKNDGYSKELEDMSFKEMRQYFSAVQKHASVARMEQNKIKLVDGPNTLFGVLRNHSQVKQDSRRYAQKQVISRIIKREQEDFDRWMAQQAPGAVSRVEKESFHAFIVNVAQDPQNLLRHRGTQENRKWLDGWKRQKSDEIIQNLQRQISFDGHTPEGKAFFQQVDKEEERFNKAIQTIEEQDLKTLEGWKKTFGDHTENSWADKAAQRFLPGKSRAMTMGEIWHSSIMNEFEDRFFDPDRKKQTSFQNTIRQMMNEFKKTWSKEDFNELLNMRVDPTLRIDADGAYSSTAGQEIQKQVYGAIANSLPGKILKFRELHNEKVRPYTIVISHLDNDSYMQAYLKEIGEQNSDAIVRGNQIYTLAQDGTARNVTGELAEKGIELKVVSKKHGFQHDPMNALAGNQKYKESDNFIQDWLQLRTDREKYDGSGFHNISTVFTKTDDPKFRGNRVRRVLNPGYEEELEYQDIMANGTWNTSTETDSMRKLRHRIEDYNKLDEIFRQNTYAFTGDILRAMEEVIPKTKEHERAHKIIELLRSAETGDEKLDKIVDPFSPYSLKGAGSGGGGYLAPLMSKLMTNANNRQEMGHIVNQLTWRQRISVEGSLGALFETNYVNEHMGVDEIVQKDLSAELLYSIGIQKTKDKKLSIDYDKINQVVDKVSEKLSTNDADELNKMAQYYIGRNYVMQDVSTGKLGPDGIELKVARIHDLGVGEEEWQKRYRETAKQVSNAEISSLERTANEDEEFYSNDQGESWGVVRKAVAPMDIIRNLNDTQKATAMFKGMFRQFAASSDDLQNVTTATLLPLFIMKRLSNDLNGTLGIGLDGRSFTSNQKAIASIALKRLLPVALAYEYGEWGDDTVQALTGQSPIGAMANGVANLDLAARKMTGILGMDDWINQEKSINPIMQYIGGHDDYNDYEQRKKYYQEGYTPVRKARGWTFGGVQELRGGEIQYFEPTFARRINSDYKDKSLYNGYWDKWSHSWLPTPTNPLSPVFAFMNPYHLEEEHAEDRPYVVSGKMFQEGTPWGAVLNPTLGAILKPQKELHEARFRNGVDSKSLIHNINLSIKQWARNLTDSNDIFINGKDFTPVTYNNYNAPTEDTKIGTVITNADGTASTVSGVYGAPTGSGGIGTSNGSSGGGTGAGGGYGLGGFGQNLQAGFNKLQGPSAARELLRLDEHGHPSFKEVLREALLAPGEQVVRNGDLIVNDKGELGTYSQSYRGTNDLTFEEKSAIAAHSDNPVVSSIGRIIGDVYTAADPYQLIGKANAGIKARAAAQKADVPYAVDGDDGFTSPAKMSRMKPSTAMELLKDPDTVTELVNAGKGNDFVRDATSSWRLIGGIYGYIGSEAFGIGSYEDKRLATSSDMASYTRGFWDMNLGGFGGDVADIIHRFIPDFKRGRRVNPLMNNMPDWMPERYRYGDPYTSVPLGEARMPGKGYESLNDLHPDQFGNYGAFDRMKILADIAPFSPEYKMWRQIAKKTVTDPELIQQMEDIKDRVRQQGQHHDFYNYKVLGHGLEYSNIVVSEVLGYGRFRSGDRIYKVAGVTVQSRDGMSMQETLGQYLHPGMSVTIAVDANESYLQNKDSARSTNAAVFIDGESLSEQMLEAGDAKKRKGDTTAAATLATMSPMQKLIAGTSEFIGHLDIPWLSDQYLRIRSPLESYKAEQDYGTPYQSWAHPIDTMLRPALERAVYDRSYLTYVGNYAYNVFQANRDKISKDAFHAVQVGHFLTNRASFAAAATAKLIDDRLVNKFDRKFNTAVGIAHFMSGGNDYFDEMSYGAVIGFDIAKRMENPRGVIGKALAIGAAAGAVMHHIKGDSVYIPDRTKQKWDVEDYFDRLTYMKYMGLYEEATRMAEKEDGVDVKNIIEQAEKKAQITEARIAKYKNLKQKLDLSNNQQKDPEKILLDKILTDKINALSAEPAKLMDGSKWAMSALVYKQAAESTMQGLNTHSSWSQIVTALPTNDREYFMEFVKERDDEKRRKILEYVSPQLRKALNLAWGKVKKDKSDSDKMAENKQYFKNHYLPSEEWEGWTPDVDLKDVQIKTIANEGMNLSDFGFYESSLRNPQVQDAPALKYHRRNSSENVSRNIKRVLAGKGLKNVDVDVTSRTSLDYSTVKADIKTFISGREQQKRIERSMKDNSV